MAERTYMQVDERHDHGFQVPRPDLSVAIGTPNTCNDCHQDRSSAWAAAAVEQWTGHVPPAHPALLFAAAAQAIAEAAAPLAGLCDDPLQPAIVRATALDLLSNYADAGPLKLRHSSDPDPLVRAASLRRLGAVPQELLLQYVRPRLEDPTRLVRIAAARALTGTAGAVLEAAADPAYLAAKAELLASFAANSDAPYSTLDLAIYKEQDGDAEGAIAAYRHALFLDRDFLPAVFNLANLLAALRREDEAEELLREAVGRHPGEGELAYSLGLLLAQMERFEDAADALRRAAEQLPGRPRVHYNAGLVAWKLGRLAEAATALSRAVELAPADPELTAALRDFQTRR
jgi:tetratricopeptide (TPR) repeat protein